MVSIVIPSRNNEERIGRTLAAIFAQNRRDFEVISCDDNSNDRTPVILDGYPEVRQLHMPPGRHFPGELLNRAIPECRGEIIVINHAGSCPLDADYLDNLVKPLEENPGIVYHGEVTGHRKKHRLFWNANVILVPSFDESCSLTALEGAMYGRALLVTENVGANYLARGGGLIVPAGSAKALAEAMEFLIENCFLLGEMGRQAHENFCRMASADDYYTRLTEIFRKIREEQR